MKGKTAQPKGRRGKGIGSETGGNPQEARKFYNEGKKFLLGKGNVQYDIEKAFQFFSEACNKDPSFPGAYHYRGRCYLGMYDYQRALYDFTFAIKLDAQADGKTLAEHYNFAGQCHQELGQLDEALKHYEVAVKKDSTNGKYYYNRALVKSKLDKFEEAIDDYNKALDNLSDQADLYQARFNKGVCLRRLGKLKESIDDLKKAVEMRNDKASAHNNLGLSYFEKEDFEDALNEFSKAIQLEPHSFHYNNRGLAYYHIGKLKEAKDDYDEAIQRNPDDPFFYFNRGNVFLNQEEYDSAHEDYDKAISIQPDNPKFWQSKGLAYEGKALSLNKVGGDKEQKDIAKQNIDKAVTMYTKALGFNENFVSSRFHLGLMYHRTNEFQKALICFSNVLDPYYPDDKTVYIARGLVYQDMGNHQFAIKDFNKAIELDPKFDEAYYRRGVSLLKSRQYQEAIENFQKSLELDVDQENPGVYDGQGCCYHALGDYKEALNYFNQAITKDPENINFLMNRAQCYYDQGSFTQSIDDLNTALNINESDPQVLYKLGLSFYAYQKFKKCIKTLKKALQCNPYFTYESDIYYHIGLAYCHLEKFEKSIYPYTKCIEMIPSEIRYIHERAKAYQMIEDHEKAVEDFTSVIKKNPKNAHAHFRRAFSLKALKRYAEAADDFERSKELDPMNPKLVVNYKKLKGVSCIVLCKPGEEKIY